MTLADKVTSIRLVLAPVFFAVYLGYAAFFKDAPPPPLLTLLWVIFLWVLFAVSEITDLLDGKIARARKEVSDFGKLYDPFADTLVRITYFLCFVVDGIFPAPLLLIVLYREFSILFLRNLMIKTGLVQGARSGGKIKAFTYMLAGATALLAVSADKLGLGANLFFILRTTSLVLFAISVILAVISFLDYLNIYRKRS